MSAGLHRLERACFQDQEHTTWLTKHAAMCWQEVTAQASAVELRHEGDAPSAVLDLAFYKDASLALLLGTPPDGAGGSGGGGGSSEGESPAPPAQLVLLQLASLRFVPVPLPQHLSGPGLLQVRAARIACLIHLTCLSCPSPLQPGAAIMFDIRAFPSPLVTSL